MKNLWKLPVLAAALLGSVYASAQPKTARSVMVQVNGVGGYHSIDNGTVWTFDPTAATAYFTNSWNAVAATVSFSGAAVDDTPVNTPLPPLAPAPLTDVTQANNPVRTHAIAQRGTFLHGGHLAGNTYTQNVVIPGLVTGSYTYTFTYDVTPSGPVNWHTAWSDAAGTSVDFPITGFLARETLSMSARGQATPELKYSFSLSKGEVQKMEAVVQKFDEGTNAWVSAGTPVSFDPENSDMETGADYSYFGNIGSYGQTNDAGMFTHAPGYMGADLVSNILGNDDDANNDDISNSVRCNFNFGSFSQTDDGTYRIFITGDINGKAVEFGSNTVVIGGAQPPSQIAKLQSIAADPTQVVGGTNITGTITLTTAAPVGGLTVNLSEDSVALSLPSATVFIPQGSVTGTFAVETTDVDAAYTRQIVATQDDVTIPVDVVLTPQLRLRYMFVDQATVYGGTQAEGKVVLSIAAPSGGTVVNLSTDSSFLSVASTVTVPEGEIEATFPINTSEVKALATRAVVAKFGTVERRIYVTLAPALVGLSADNTTIEGGSSATGTVTIGVAAPAGGTEVSLSDNTSAISTPASVTVPEGQTSATFAIDTTKVSAQAVRQITATFMGKTKTMNITLVPATTITGLTLSESTVVGGTSLQGTVSLNKAAGSGGVVVTITDNSSAISSDATITVPEGETSAVFTINTTTVSSTFTRTVSVTLNGVTKTKTITLTPAGA